MFQSLSPELQSAALVLLALIAVISLYRFWVQLDTLSFMHTAATSKARSASQGYVELSGVAQPLPGPSVVAPLSRKDCLWYEFVASGFASDVFTLIPREKGRSDAIFYLEDESGHCIIDPDGARITAAHRDTWFGDTQRPELKSFGWKLEWMGWLHHRMQYREQRIEPGDQLYVIGEFQSLHEDQQRSHEHEAASILRAWKTDPMRMRQIDSNRNGQIDPEEWEAARKEAFTRAALKIHAEGKSEPINILRKPANSHQPFVIAAHSEARTAQLIQRKAVGSALLFVAAIILITKLVALI